MMQFTHPTWQKPQSENWKQAWTYAWSRLGEHPWGKKIYFKQWMGGVISLGLVFLSGCQPLLTPTMQHHMQHVRIQRIDNRIGQKLRQHLQQWIHPVSENALYTLDVVLIEQDRHLVLNRQGQCSVEHYILKANYTLSRLKDACVLSKGSLRLYGVKPLTVSYYSQTIMDEATQDRALMSATERLITMMAMALNKQPTCGCPLIPESAPKYESYTNQDKKR